MLSQTVRDLGLMLVLVHGCSNIPSTLYIVALEVELEALSNLAIRGLSLGRKVYKINCTVIKIISKMEH